MYGSFVNFGNGTGWNHTLLWYWNAVMETSSKKTVQHFLVFPSPTWNGDLFQRWLGFSLERQLSLGEGSRTFLLCGGWGKLEEERRKRLAFPWLVFWGACSQRNIGLGCYAFPRIDGEISWHRAVSWHFQGSGLCWSLSLFGGNEKCGPLTRPMGLRAASPWAEPLSLDSISMATLLAQGPLV